MTFRQEGVIYTTGILTYKIKMHLQIQPCISSALLRLQQVSVQSPDRGLAADRMRRERRTQQEHSSKAVVKRGRAGEQFGIIVVYLHEFVHMSVCLSNRIGFMYFFYCQKLSLQYFESAQSILNFELHCLDKKEIFCKSKFNQIHEVYSKYWKIFHLK